MDQYIKRVAKEMKVAKSDVTLIPYDEYERDTKEGYKTESFEIGEEKQ